ncbi:MAG: DinB family protein, partial [Planctomycetota bacterium]
GDDARTKPAPDKWAKIEILGHLIDSSINNHRRFIVAISKDDLVFEGYDQELWAEVQSYLGLDWSWLVEHWLRCNQHLANLLGRIPGEALTRQRQPHCLHKMAWKRVPEDVPTTLQYLIQDYLGHLEHHLRQILPEYEPVVMGTYEYSV